MGVDRVKLLCLATIFLLLAACSSPFSGSRLTAPFDERTIALGDWNDIDAAVIVGAPKVDMTVIGDLPSEDKTTLRRLALRTAGDEPVTLTFSRRSGGMDTGPQSIEIAASVGRVGNPGRERALVRAVRDRLEQLSGVDHSPVR